MVLGPVDEVGDDEEVAGKAHLRDAAQLGLEPLPVAPLILGGKGGADLADVGQPLFQAGLGLLLQHLVEGLFGGLLVLGKMIGVEVEVEVAALGDGHGVADRLGVLAEERLHLLRALDVELAVGETHPRGVVHGLAGLDAEQHLVGVGVLPGQVVAVVGRHQRQVETGSDLGQPPVDRGLLGDEVLLQLEEEAVVVEDLRHLPGAALGLLRAVEQQQGGDLPTETGSQRDEPLVVLAQQFPVDARPVVEPFPVSGRDQVAEVAVADGVLAEQEQMVGSFRGTPGVGLLETGAGSDVDLAADDRLDPRPPSLAVELQGAEHVAVVGDRQGRHAELFGLLHQIADLDGPVEEAVLAVQVQMDEVRMFHRRVRREVSGERRRKVIGESGAEAVKRTDDNTVAVGRSRNQDCSGAALLSLQSTSAPKCCRISVSLISGRPIRAV